MPRPIYLDAAATTPLLPEALEAMRPYLTEAFGNPASPHWAGRRARRGLEEARERVADLLGASPDGVIFTGGATEANNLALFGLCGGPPARVAVGPVEHPSALEPARVLGGRGFDVDYLPIDGYGVASVDGVGDARLASLQLVNHETGAAQPVRELVERLGPRAAVHTDAAQAVGKVPVHFGDLGVTALTVSGHKFGGPKGVGALLLKSGRRLTPQVWGGHQQQGRRPGTESPALAAGLAAALDVAVANLDANLRHAESLRAAFLTRLPDDAVVNGPVQAGRRVPHIVNVSFPGVASDLLLVRLDLDGVACSAGAACSSGSTLPSPVLRAMNVGDARLKSAVRFSFPAGMTGADAAEAAERVTRAVAYSGT